MAFQSVGGLAARILREVEAKRAARGQTDLTGAAAGSVPVVARPVVADVAGAAVVEAGHV